MKIKEIRDTIGQKSKPDVIRCDVPLFIRLLEYAREDATTDVQLHNLAEKAIKASEGGVTLRMSNYDMLIGGKVDDDKKASKKNFPPPGEVSTEGSF